MDSMVGNKVQPVVRKVKKKQVKGELDRLKQAEKKKRRLEKALATSAAIRSELEKKKQKKKEEQQRLDEEGAAIAEAVALHVLIGEDSEESCKIVLNKEEGFNPWNRAANIDLFMDKQRAYLPHPEHSRHSFGTIGLFSSDYGIGGCNWTDMENSDRSFSYNPLGRNFRASYNAGWGATDFSAGLIAAQAVSSLHIAEDAGVDTIVFDGILRG